MPQRRFVAFCRVSTRSQENNNSLVNQKTAIEYWEKMRVEQGISILPAGWISVVESATCFTEDRARFKEALELVNQPDCSGLVVYDLDRFFRNAEEGLRIARTEFKEKGKTLISINQNVDIETDDGWFMFGLFLLNAEREGRQIKKRFRTGKEQKVKSYADNGQLAYLNGHPPYGWVAKGSKGRRTLVPDPFQQKWRNQIFRWLDSGRGPYWIARELTNMEIPTPNGKRVWSECTIRTIKKRELKLAPLLDLAHAD